MHGCIYIYIHVYEIEFYKYDFPTQMYVCFEMSAHCIRGYMKVNLVPSCRTTVHMVNLLKPVGGVFNSFF